MNRNKLIYLVVDGARARFVVRSPETGDFVTVRELDGAERLAEARAKLRAAAAGRSFESATSARHAVGRGESADRRVKAAFAAEAAKAALETAAARGCDEVVLVASGRLLPQLRRGLDSSLAVVAEVDKDLTKVPDHALAEWLGPLVPRRPAEAGAPVRRS
jgi:protein required for attachment to host cells